MRGRRGALLGAAGLLCGACSLLIGSETAPLHCSQEGQLGPPACDVGFVCREEVCQLAPPPTQGDGGEGGSDRVSPPEGGGEAGVTPR